jgi:hypothetical protein
MNEVTADVAVDTEDSLNGEGRDPKQEVLEGDGGFHPMGVGGMSRAFRAVNWSCFGVSG